MEIKSTTLADFAKQYVPPVNKTKNIADLPYVSTKVEIKQTEPKTNKDGSTFQYYYIEFKGEQYRVPKTVITALQTALKFNPKLEFFKVKREGVGKDDTKYTVEPYDPTQGVN